MYNFLSSYGEILSLLFQPSICNFLPLAKITRVQGLLFYLVIPFIYLISFLPFWILYRLSDLTFFFLYYLFRYRRNVVRQNIQNSFPEKTPGEINKIVKGFYHHLCDLIVESVKTFTISKEQVVKRCRIHPESLTLLDQLYADKKSLILVMGHYGNWEWGGLSFSANVKHQLFFIYKPLSNTYFDRLILKMRSRFGARLVTMNNVFKEMVNNRHIISATAFIADQAPPPESAHWTTFLNQETPVFAGTEKIARKLNYPVVFINIKKIRRGYYELFAELLIDEPKATSEGEVSDIHTKRLELEIVEHPEFWLWSHRRWKHKKSVARDNNLNQTL